HAGVVPSRVSPVLRQLQDALGREARPDALDRVVARAVVDDEHRGALEVGRLRALEALPLFAAAVPVEHHDGDLVSGHAGRSASLIASPASRAAAGAREYRPSARAWR